MLEVSTLYGVGECGLVCERRTAGEEGEFEIASSYP
jgi:hypothetical protein